MTPERWRAVKDVFDNAVQQDGTARSAYLQRACRDDPSLRGEIEAMLASDAVAGTFMERPAASLHDVPALDTAERAMPETGSVLAHYRVVSELGAGGMGRVYRAEDMRLGRIVALKVLTPEWGKDAAARARFEREARLASALDHPNICTIYEVGEHAGVPFIAMQYLDGETLQQLARRGPLPLDLLRSVTIEVADALAAAHARGIIHRDVKSSNVIVTNDGRVHVLDFGVAKLLDRAHEASSAPDATESGVIVGTPSYLSPEQARGAPVDHRTDVFSFGTVLYEMATGQLPFGGATGADTIAAILTQPHAPADHINPALPASLVAIIDRALNKEPNDRFQSVDEIKSALQRIEAGDIDDLSTRSRGHGSSGGFAPVGRRWSVRRRIGVGVATAVMAAVVGVAGRSVVRYGSAIDSIAVVPFASPQNTADLEYLGEGIADGVIQRLAELPATRVIARSTSFLYKDTADPRTVGRELRVRAVLTGEVARHDEMLVVRVELVDVDTGSRLWGSEYRRAASELATVPGDVARAVSQELRTRVTGEQARRLAQDYTRSPGAYQQYLKGRFFWNKRTADGYARAIEYFTATVTADPTFALAYSGLADSYSVLHAYGLRSSGDVIPLARAAAERAVQLDPSLAEAQTSRARIASDTRQWAEAESAFSRAIALNPNYATVHHWQAMYLAEVGRLGDALAAIRRAQAVDPLSLIINTEVGRLLYFAGDYDAAIEQLSHTLELDPGFALAHSHLGSVLLAKGRFSDAMHAIRKAAAAGGAMPALNLARAYALTGDRKNAEALLREILDAPTPVQPYALAVLYVTRDDHEQAIDWIERGVAQPGGGWFLPVNPVFRPLQTHPRFRALLRRLQIRP
jgi:eukaryotic-like serine/threonine-protein kinase